MDVRYNDQDLERLETEPGDRGFPPEVVRGFRKVMGFVHHAADERDLRTMKSLRFEKLKGKRQHQRSLRVNDQWRLIVELLKDDRATAVIVVALENHYE